MNSNLEFANLEFKTYHSLKSLLENVRKNAIVQAGQYCHRTGFVDVCPFRLSISKILPEAAKSRNWLGDKK